PRLSAARARQPESIARAAHRLNGVDAIVGVQLPPQSQYQYVEHIPFTVPVTVVETLAQLAFGDNLSGVEHQVLEHAVLESRQLHRHVGHAHGSRDEVQYDRLADELG